MYWGRQGNVHTVSWICKTICWHNDFCCGQAEQPPHQAAWAASAQRGESAHGGSEPGPTARAGACELPGFLTSVCASGLWGAAWARTQLEAPHLQQKRCKSRGVLVRPCWLSWGACAQNSMRARARGAPGVTGACWFWLGKGVQRFVGLVTFLKCLVLTLVCCITCVDPECIVHRLPVNYMLSIINKPHRFWFGLNYMNWAAFPCHRSQVLLENDLSNCIEIPFNVKKEMALYFSH